MSGTVFRDFNANGIKDNANEPGVGGVTVTAFFNNISAAATTNATTGAYSFTAAQIPNTTRVRLEFSGYQTGDFSAPFAAAAAGNGTSVRFVPAGTAATNLNFAVNLPSDYCQLNPKLVTPCYIDGRVENNATGLTDVLVSVNYTDAVQTSKTGEAIHTEIGSTWGIGWAKQTKKLYSAAFLKRHVGLKDAKLGQIYVSDFLVIGKPATPWLDVSALGGLAGNWTFLTDAQRGLGNAGVPSIDSVAFSKIATTGWGDIDVSEDEKTLYVMDLINKQLLSIDIATKTLNGKYPVPELCAITSSTSYFSAAVTNATFKGADEKLWQKGFLFNLTAAPIDYVQTITNPNNAGAGTSNAALYLQWNNIFPNITGLGINCAGFTVYTQPTLSDIEFDDDGSMILAFFDRFGHQQGSASNFTPDGRTTGTLAAVGGDILRAFFNGTSFELENNGKKGVSSNKPATAGANNGQGIGGGEFYLDDTGIHQEISAGGLAIKRGSGKVRMSAGDPIVLLSGGLTGFDNVTGVKQNDYTLYVGTGNGLQGKSNGVGDLEVLCNPAPIEIGNRVWKDDNRDGIQDPGEPGISDVKVDLCLASAPTTIIATATTDANGNYYFSSATGTNTNSVKYGLNSAVNTDYILKFPVTTGGQVLPSKDAGSNANDAIDSDADATGKITFKTGAIGENNHTYDVGYGVCVPPTRVVTITDPTCTDGGQDRTVQHQRRQVRHQQRWHLHGSSLRCRHGGAGYFVRHHQEQNQQPG